MLSDANCQMKSHVHVLCSPLPEVVMTHVGLEKRIQCRKSLLLRGAHAQIAAPRIKVILELPAGRKHLSAAEKRLIRDLWLRQLSTYQGISNGEQKEGANATVAFGSVVHLLKERCVRLDHKRVAVAGGKRSKGDIEWKATLAPGNDMQRHSYLGELRWMSVQLLDMPQGWPKAVV